MTASSTNGSSLQSSSSTTNHNNVNHHLHSSNNSNNPIQPSHGVNVLLGGAMMSGIILVIFIMCYCCHKNARKQQDGTVPITYWRDSALPLHVYTVEGHRHLHHHQCCEGEDLMLVDIRRRPSTPPPPPPGPPPSYEVAVGSVETPSPSAFLTDPLHHHRHSIAAAVAAAGGNHLQGSINHINNGFNNESATLSSKRWPTSIVRRHSVDANGLPSYERAIQMQSIGHF